MKLATYRPSIEEGGRLGAVVGDTIVDLERLGTAMGVTLPNRMLEFIDLGRLRDVIEIIEADAEDILLKAADDGDRGQRSDPA